MNPWQDLRLEQAEIDVFEAERAERNGNPSAAHQRYRAAGEVYASVALAAGADYPNSRGDLAIAAVASFARAGDFGRAVDFARRILAESDALSKSSHAELLRLAKDYAGLIMNRSAPAAPRSRGDIVRAEVRRRFGSAA